MTTPHEQWRATIRDLIAREKRATITRVAAEKALQGIEEEEEV